MFIEKLNLTADLTTVEKNLSVILNSTTWGDNNQIGLTYRPNAVDVWHDSTGSLYDRVNNVELVKESEFTELNPSTPEYLTYILNELCKLQNIKIGRARFMRLLPKTGLSVHADTSERYHLVIKTNKDAFIAHTMKTGILAAACFHMPADATFYKVDTKMHHFVYNGGSEDRIHLVISPK